MKVNNSPSFGSKILYSAKLKDTNFLGIPRKIDVLVSELKKSDLDVIKNTNPTLLNTSYGGQALCAFADECLSPLSQLGTARRFIVVETPKKMNGEIYKGIAQIEEKEGALYVKRLQSLAYIPMYRKIKGIGSSIMYSIFKMAQQMNKKSVMLNADCRAAQFYRNIGMYPTTPMGFTFQVHHSRFDKVAKDIADKYCIQEVKS